MLPAMAGCMARQVLRLITVLLMDTSLRARVLVFWGQRYGQNWLTSQGALVLVFCYAACVRQLLLPAVAGFIIGCSIKEFDD